jgi:hypothetical protein
MPHYVAVIPGFPEKRGRPAERGPPIRVLDRSNTGRDQGSENSGKEKKQGEVGKPETRPAPRKTKQAAPEQSAAPPYESEKETPRRKSTEGRPKRAPQPAENDEGRPAARDKPVNARCSEIRGALVAGSVFRDSGLMV